MAPASIRAVPFDVFGSVVDWGSSLICEGEALGRAKGLRVSWSAFADAWRGFYQPMLERVRSGTLPWTKLDDLHRMALDQLLVQFGVIGLTEEEIDHLNRAWHRHGSGGRDRKSTRLNSSHGYISYAVFCLKKKK